MGEVVVISSPKSKQRYVLLGAAFVMVPILWALLLAFWFFSFGPASPLAWLLYAAQGAVLALGAVLVYFALASLRPIARALIAAAFAALMWVPLVFVSLLVGCFNGHCI